MNKTWSLRILVLLSLLGSMLLSAAAPMPAASPAASAQTEPDHIRLKINNRSSSSVFFRLEGPATYALRVQDDTVETFAVRKGSYTYWVTGCGFTTKGSLELTTHKTVVVPVCGGNAGRAAHIGNKLDLSNQLKVVKVTLKNETNTNALVILTGPGSYVFRFNKEEKAVYTLARGQYTAQIFACGTVFNRKLQADKGSTWELTCPK